MLSNPSGRGTEADGASAAGLRIILIESMSKKLIILLVVAVLGAGVWYFWKGAGSKTIGGTVGGTVTYMCDGNKSFTLVYVDKDTVRLQGTGITSINLDKNIADFWISADSKTVVKTVGSYVVLSQNDRVTYDRCVAK